MEKNVKITRRGFMMLGAAFPAAALATRQPSYGAEAKAVETSWVDPTDFGADPKGSADSTAAILAAAKFAADSTRPLLLSGVFKVDPKAGSLHCLFSGGQGRLATGAKSSFYPFPSSKDRNVFYVDPAKGDDGWLGTDPGAPLASAQAALDLVAAYGALCGGVLCGRWVVKLAAGRYPGGCHLRGVLSQSRIVIEGVAGEGGRPLTIFDGFLNDAQKGLSFSGQVLINARNLGFVNFKGKKIGIGLLAENGANLLAENIHAEECDWAGIDFDKLVRGYVAGGVIRNCHNGIRAYAGSVFSIGHKTENVSVGPLIEGSKDAAVYILNNSSGHLDYTTLRNNVVGLDVTNQSRVHVLGCEISGSSMAGVRLRNQSTWFDDRNNIFGNAVDVGTGAFCNELAQADYMSELGASVYKSPVEVNGKAEGVAFGKPFSINAKRFRQCSGSVRVAGIGEAFGGGAKSLLLKTPGGAIRIFQLAGVGAEAFSFECEIFSLGEGGQLASCIWRSSGGGSGFDSRKGDFFPDSAALSELSVNADVESQGSGVRISVCKLFCRGF